MPLTERVWAIFGLKNCVSPTNGYFLSFVVEILPEVLPKTDNSVGIGSGIKTKASCRDALMQPPYAVKKINAPKLLKKRIKKYRI